MFEKTTINLYCIHIEISTSHPLSYVIPRLDRGIQKRSGPIEKIFCVYILANRRNGTLYIGVTSDLAKRIYQHKSGKIPGFTQKYNVKNLVYYEIHSNAESAIHREKRLKEWKRKRKLALIEKTNPDWNDLYNKIVM